MADQVGKKQDRAIEQGDDDDFASAKIPFDLLRKRRDAVRKLFIRDEDFFDIPAPAQGYPNFYPGIFRLGA